MPRGARGAAAPRARKRNQSVHGRGPRGPREPRVGSRHHAATRGSSSGRAPRRAAALVRLLVQARGSCDSFEYKLNEVRRGKYIFGH